MSEFFSQTCPTCGRQLFINDDHARQMVACQHCQAAFLASDPLEPAAMRNHWGDALLDRADELLALAELRLAQATNETGSLTVVT